MLKFGLIGHPIGHSGSPALFRKSYPAHCGADVPAEDAWCYDLIETESFDEAWDRFLAGYQSINITAPFKELAAARADLRSEEVEKIGAANIAVKTSDGIKAYNSDYLGLLQLLRIVPGKPQTALVVGYGGAGMAAAQACRDLGMDVVICNRSIKAPGMRPLDELPILATVADLMIYALAMPVPGIESLRVPVILEANYRTRSFDAEAISAAGCVYIPGDEWLKAQAETGYAIMTGENPEKI